MVTKCNSPLPFQRMESYPQRDVVIGGQLLCQCDLRRIHPNNFPNGYLKVNLIYNALLFLVHHPSQSIWTYTTSVIVAAHNHLPVRFNTPTARRKPQQTPYGEYTCRHYICLLTWPPQPVHCSVTMFRRVGTQLQSVVW